MPHPVDVQVVPPQLEAAVENVFSGVLPMVERGDTFGACAVAGELKGVQTFDPSELPEGSRFVPFSPDNDDLMEVPPYISERTDPRITAHQIAQNIGSISVTPEAPGIMKIHAPDGGVHTLLTLKPDALLKWLAERGYQPQETLHATLEEAETTRPQPTPEPATEINMQPVAAESASPQAAEVFEPGKRRPLALSDQEQLSGMRRILNRVGQRLPGLYDIEPWEVGHAWNSLTDRELARVMGNEGPFAYEQWRDGVSSRLKFNETTTRVIKAAYQEVIRSAPDAKAYIPDLRGASLAALARNEDIRSHIQDADEARRTHGLLTSLSAEPIPRRRAGNAELTGRFTMQEILASLNELPKQKAEKMAYAAEATLPAIPHVAPHNTRCFSENDMSTVEPPRPSLAQRAQHSVRRAWNTARNKLQGVLRRVSPVRSIANQS